jgi:arsenate reductase (glutaredoxin)
MSVKIYGIKNCDTMKKAFKWLNEHEIEYTFINFKETPLSIIEIERFAYFVGLDTLVNRRGTTWKMLDLGNRDVSDEELIYLTFENQTLIKRPVLELDGSIMVGFDADAYEAFFEE